MIIKNILDINRKNKHFGFDKWNFFFKKLFISQKKTFKIGLRK